MKKIISFIMLCSFFIAGSVFADNSFITVSKNEPLAERDVPPQLKGWEKWALDGYKKPVCDFAASNEKEKFCYYVSELSLDVLGRTLNFNMRVKTLEEGMVLLPGSKDVMPAEVTSGGRRLAVLEKNSRPYVLLAAGEYLITGVARSKENIRSFYVPNEAAVLNLRINGKSISGPTIEKDGTLRLDATTSGKKETDDLSYTAVRKISDGVPLTQVLHIDLNVTGSQRVENLGKVIPENFTPMSINNQIPAHIQKNGELIAEVRPGNWWIEITFRQINDTLTISTEELLSESEVWVLEKAADRRVIRESSTMRPMQTKNIKIPDSWRKLPAYEVRKGEDVTLTSIPYTANREDELGLRREIKLSYDGKFYSVRDNISAKFKENGRLNLATPFKLSSAEIDGEAQSITTDEASKLGLEVRKGNSNLTTVSRAESKIGLPVTGYDRTFETARWSLSLSPGYKLFAVSGADKVSDSWVSNWDLLSIFIVAVMGVILYYLFDRPKAILGTCAFILLHPVFPAFTSTSFMICAAIFVLRYLDQKSLAYRFVKFLKISLMLFLGLATLSFLVVHLREVIYPVFDTGYVRNPLGSLLSPSFLASFYVVLLLAYWIVKVFTNPASTSGKKGMAIFAAIIAFIVFVSGSLSNFFSLFESGVRFSQHAVYELASSEPFGAYDGMVLAKKSAPRSRMAVSASNQMLTENFKMMNKNVKLEQYQSMDLGRNRIQTGVGFPSFSTKSIDITLKGKVNASDKFGIYVISPTLNLFITLAQMLLAAMLLLYFSEMKVKLPASKNGKKKWYAKFLPLIMLAMFVPSAARANELPSEQMLKELKTKLTREEKAACLPDCAAIPQGRLVITGNQLTLNLQVHASSNKTVVPLPSIRADGAGFAKIEQVLVNGAPYSALIRKGDNLNVSLNKGVHQITIRALLDDNSDSFSITASKPKIGVMSSELSGFAVNESVTSGSQVFQINRTKRAVAKSNLSSSSRIEMAAFFEITRSMDIGALWQVTTTVRRINQSQGSASIDVPLLEGEKVISLEGTLLKDAIRLSFAPSETVKTFSSLLPVDQAIHLFVPQNVKNYREVWRLNLETTWSMKKTGIDPIVDNSSRTVFKPSAGDSLVLSMLRPAGVDGEVITFDSVTYNISSARQITSLELFLKMRASEAGTHSITLPKDTVVKELQINSENYPVVQKGRELNIPVTAGSSEVLIKAEVKKEMGVKFSFPKISLNAPSVDINQKMEVSANRWLLFTAGPVTGPAVLFWSQLPLLLLLAFVLARAKSIPMAGWQWFVLLLGLTQANILVGVAVVGWFVLIAAREKITASGKLKNAIQILIVIATIIFIYALFKGVKGGLLGIWDMKISGNNSFFSWSGDRAWMLNWYQDASSNLLPTPWVISLPVAAYRVLMVLWSVWLAFSFIGWIKWGARIYGQGGLWNAKSAGPKVTSTKKKRR